MSDGIYVNVDGRYRRPKSKKEIKELAASHPFAINIEGTSLYNPWSGTATEIPEGTRIDFVGPDPFNNRKFYGTITRTGDKVTVR